MENQRVRLSKTLLKNALLELLKEKPLEKISIYELCDKAQINRTTFYKYYGSQNDLLLDIENELFAKLSDKIKELGSNGTEGLAEILRMLVDESDTVITLINTVPDEIFSKKLFSLPIINELLDSEIPKEFSKKEREYIFLFFCQGCYAIIRKWLNNENREPAEMIAELTLNLIGRISK